MAYSIDQILRKWILPINLTKLAKKAFKLKVSHFHMLGGILYCRGFNGMFLRCLEWVDS